MRTRYSIAFLFIAGLFFASCRAEQRPENIYIAGQEDSGQAVTMGVGDVLQVVLRENRSTGYLWSVVTNDEAILKTDGEPDYVVESDAAGAGGEVTYAFQAVAPGTSMLRMVNAMQQDTAVEPAEVYELTVTVSE